MAFSGKRVVPGSDTQLYLLSGKLPVLSKEDEIHNLFFDYWHDFWLNVFKDNGTNEKPTIEDFYRQDIIFGLLGQDSEIIGSLSSSLYNLNSRVLDCQNYFLKSYDFKILDLLRQENIKSIMTLEYLGVNGEYRLNSASISNASLFFGVACTYFLNLDVDAIIASCRVDRKVNEKLIDFGAEPIGEEFYLHGTPCQAMLLKKENFSHHPDDLVVSTYQGLLEKSQSLNNFNVNNLQFNQTIQRRTAA